MAEMNNANNAVSFAAPAAGYTSNHPVIDFGSESFATPVPVTKYGQTCRFRPGPDLNISFENVDDLLKMLSQSRPSTLDVTRYEGGWALDELCGCSDLRVSLPSTTPLDQNVFVCVDIMGITYPIAIDLVRCTTSHFSWYICLPRHVLLNHGVAVASSSCTGYQLYRSADKQKKLYRISLWKTSEHSKAVTFNDLPKNPTNKVEGPPTPRPLLPNMCLEPKAAAGQDRQACENMVPVATEVEEGQAAGGDAEMADCGTSGDASCEEKERENGRCVCRRLETPQKNVTSTVCTAAPGHGNNAAATTSLAAAAGRGANTVDSTGSASETAAFPGGNALGVELAAATGSGGNDMGSAPLLVAAAAGPSGRELMATEAERLFTLAAATISANPNCSPVIVSALEDALALLRTKLGEDEASATQCGLDKESYHTKLAMLVAKNQALGAARALRGLGP